MHPPTTGTSAANLLYRYACDVPYNDQVGARLPHVYLREKYPPEKMCSKLHNKTHHRFGLHDPIGSSKYGASHEELQGRLVISLRSNEARFWRSFMHSLRNIFCSLCQKIYGDLIKSNMEGSSGNDPSSPSVLSPGPPPGPVHLSGLKFFFRPSGVYTGRWSSRG